jgi:hypothetical protein
MEPRAKPEESIGGRRAVLRGVAALGAAAAASLVPVDVEARHGHPKKKKHPRPRATVLVFRFQTRNTQACNACQKHRRYKVFRSHAVADANRAHKGCHCPVVRQEVSKREFHRLFRHGAEVADLRWCGSKRMA